MKYYLSIISISLLLSGCYSASIMQTAKTVEKNKINYANAAAVYVGDITNEGDPESDGGALPGINLGLRYGIGPRTDIGLFYASGAWGHARADIKQNIWHSPNNNAYLSAGLALENHNFHDDQKTTGMALFNKGWSISVPLFYSINHNKDVTIYAAQRITLSFNELDLLKNWDYYTTDYILPLNVYVDRRNTLFYTGGVGFKWGKELNKKWFAEGCYTVHYKRSIYCNDSAPEENGVSLDRIIQLEFSIGLSFGNH